MRFSKFSFNNKNELKTIIQKNYTWVDIIGSDFNYT